MINFYLLFIRRKEDWQFSCLEQKDSISVSHFLEKKYFKGKLWKRSKCPIAVLVMGFIFWEVCMYV